MSELWDRWFKITMTTMLKSPWIISADRWKLQEKLDANMNKKRFKENTGSKGHYDKN